MKKTLCLVLAAALLAFSACAAPGDADSLENTAAPVSVSQPASGTDVSSAVQTADGETEHIRALLAQCGVDVEDTRFDTSCTVNRFLQCTVYSSKERSGAAAFLVERPDGSAFYITLPDNSSVTGMYVDHAGLLNVITDGVIGEGDAVMRSAMGVFKVDLAAGEAASYENNEFVYPQGVYGREYDAEDDCYTFGECTVGEDAVTFRLEPTEEKEGWTGTELYFPPVWKLLDGEYRMAVLFHNTTAPPASLAAEIETLPGVLEATFTPVDNAYYAGTLLELRMDTRCVLSHRFNEGVPGPSMESYTIRCYLPDPNDGAPVVGPFIPNPEAAADIAEKERKAMEELGMLDPTPQP